MKTRLNYHIINRLLIGLSIMMLVVPQTYATNPTANKECVGKKTFDKAHIASELDNVRKQLMAVGKSGYFNHLNGISNTDNIGLTKLYLAQKDAIREELKNYDECDLNNKATKRDIKTMLAVTLYLEDMGETLLDYLTSTEADELYELYLLLLDINNFIKDVLAT